VKEQTKSYYGTLASLLKVLSATDSNGGSMDFFSGLEVAARLVIQSAYAGNKLLFVGNGASAAISSHMAVDFWKCGGIRAMSFNDPALLTCISNDYGYSHVFEKPIEMFAETGDILFAISSSGKSENVLKASAAARLMSCRVITLSGFNENNPLRSKGDLNFYVPNCAYGPVEIIHHSICHCILDTIVLEKRKAVKQDIRT